MVWQALDDKENVSVHFVTDGTITATIFSKERLKERLLPFKKKNTKNKKTFCSRYFILASSYHPALCEKISNLYRNKKILVIYPKLGLQNNFDQICMLISKEYCKKKCYRGDKRDKTVSNKTRGVLKCLIKQQNLIQISDIKCFVSILKIENRFYC